MTKNTTRLMVTLLITFVLVKTVQAVLGFEYHLFKEGIFNLKFLADLATWGILYYLVDFFGQKVYKQKPATYSEKEQ